MEDYLLEINNLRKCFYSVKNPSTTYKNHLEIYYVLDDLSIVLPRGRITALIGGNGAGKTTLFNVISGLLPPDEGKIYWVVENEKFDLLKFRSYQIANLGIGRLFQENRIFSELSIIENMLVADENTFGELPLVSLLRPRKNKWIENHRINKVQKIFENFFGKDNEFWEKREEKAGLLSYGQQRILAFTRLMMKKYKLLLLDEPTSGVSPILIKKIKQILKKIVNEEQITIFLIEHNLKFVLEVADFCCFMDDGKIKLFGTPEDIIKNKEIQYSFIGL